MARPIDEKIIKLSLDNTEFKWRAQETLRQFGVLNKGLDANTAGNISNMASGIAAIERRFSATGVMVASIINDLTTRAMAFGRNLVGAMLDPLVEGGKKRALNIEQAKFQFEGLGMDVEATMASALAAVQGTAFGLDEAAVVAAQFGASGMEAGEDMTNALRGISGVAAMTGSAYSDVGNIFTSVAGNGRLMGNDLLRLSSRGVNAAATLADSMGISESAVREMVTKGQISFQMFAEAMDEAFGQHATKANETYTGSLSNLRAAFARIGADIFAPSFENKKNLFNALTPQVDALFAAIKPLIAVWNTFNETWYNSLIRLIDGISFEKFTELGGITNLVDAFWNTLRFGTNLMKIVKEAFQTIFPPATAEQLVRITEVFLKFTEGLSITTERGAKLFTIFQGVFAVFGIVWELAKSLGSALLQLIPGDLGGSVTDVLLRMANFAIAMHESMQAGNWLTKAIDGLGSILGDVGRVIGEVIGYIFAMEGSIVDNLGSAITWITGKLEPLGTLIKDVFKEFGGQELVGAGFFAVIYLVAQKLLEVVVQFKRGGDGIQGIGMKLKTTLGQIGGSFEAFTAQVKYVNLLMIAIAVGILAVSLKTLEGINAADLAKGIAALGTALSVMIAGMLVMSKFNVTGGLRASATLIALAIAVNIMAVALKSISDLSPQELAVGVAGLTAVVVALVAAVVVLSKWGGKIGTSSLSLLALSASIVILAKAVRQMSEIDTGDLYKAVGALALIFAALAAFLVVVKGSKFGMSSALGVVGIAAAVLVMAEGIRQIADIDSDNLIKGLSTIGAILAAVAIFAALTNGPNLMASATGLLILAGSINALVGPVTTFGQMSWEELAKGIGGMAAALVVLAGAAYLMTGGLLGAIGIGLMAASLMLLVIPIERFAAMTWGEIVKGLTGAAAALALMAAAGMLLTPALPGMLGLGAAVLLLGTAMLFGGAGMALFGTGLMALASMTAGAVLAIVSGLGLLIVGLTGIVEDIIAFVVAFSIALIDGLVAIIPALVEGLFKIILAIITTLHDHLPAILEKGSELAMAMIEGIEKYHPQLVDAGMKMMISLIDGLAEAVETNKPLLINSILGLMEEVILLFIETGAAVIDSLFGWIPGVKKVTGNIGETAEQYIRENFKAREVAEEKGNEFADTLDATSGKAGVSGKNIAIEARDGADSINFNPVGMGGGTDYAASLIGTNNLSLAAGKEIGNTAKDGAESIDFNPTGKGSGTEHANGLLSTTVLNMTSGLDVANKSKDSMASVKYDGTGKAAGTQYSTGVSSTNRAVGSSARGMAEAGRTAAGAVKMDSTGSQFGAGFARGMSSQMTNIRNRARDLAKTASNAVAHWLEIASPSKLLTRSGGFFGQGFANGISSKTKQVGSVATKMASTAKDAVNEFIDGFELPDSDNELHFKAVVDYESLDTSKFGNLNSVQIKPDTSLANSLATAISSSRYRSNAPMPSVVETSRSNNNDDQIVKQPAIVQVVTPEKRELARWLVDDITDFQDFKMATVDKF